MSDYKPQPLPDWSAIIAEKDALIRRMSMDYREEAGQLWDILALRDEEIKRLRAGGCARDQGTTQYCAEAARLAAELHIATEWSAQVHAGQQEDADTITALRAEVERLTKGRETMGNLWARDRAARVAAEAEVGWLEAARAPEMADEITNLRAAISKLESELASALTDLNTARQDNASFGPEFKRLTAEVGRLRAALEMFACDCAVHERCAEPDYCVNFQARRAALTQEPRT